MLNILGCHETCETCSGPLKKDCLTCSDEGVEPDDQGYCSNGSFIGILYLIFEAACSHNCIECSDAYHCTFCNSSKVYHSGFCKNKCPLGYEKGNMTI